MTRKPYDDRTDLEKCQSQWWKLTGLHDREESSAAIVRAATAAEIACNFAIRTEFAKQAALRADVVDKLLHDANGLQGKLIRLLGPLVKGTEREATICGLSKSVKAINDVRNGIVHRGEFSNPDEAKRAIDTTRHFIEALVHLYDPSFTLDDQSESPTSND